MTEADDALRAEFFAEDGTFLLEVRGLYWDREAFTRLERLMRQACAEHEGADALERWMVEGFWFCSDWVPTWTSHPNFPRPEPQAYYEAAIERMRDLQWWFVMGQSPYEAHHRWEDL